MTAVWIACGWAATSFAAVGAWVLVCEWRRRKDRAAAGADVADPFTEDDCDGLTVEAPPACGMPVVALIAAGVVIALVAFAGALYLTVLAALGGAR